MSEADLEMRRLSRRSFLWAGVAVIGAGTGIRKIATAPKVAGVPSPLRSALDANERIQRTIVDQAKPVRLFTMADVTELKVNGAQGLDGDVDYDAWRMTLRGLGPDVELSLEDLKRMPKHEQVTQFCCIEGWSAVQGWGGVRLIDLIRDRSPKELPEYVGVQTPDGGYFVGLEREAAIHPNTLLAYERNGQPLELEHGGPVRLVVPVKYGVKNLKRVGVVTFTNVRPKDYWAEEGYDWFAGL